MCGCLSRIPHQGPGPQPSHVPWLGVELATLWFTGWCSIQWATPARARVLKYATTINSSCHRVIFSFFLLERERKEGREKYWFVVPLYLCVLCCFSSAPWLGVESATLRYALTNWDTQPGLDFLVVTYSQSKLDMHMWFRLSSKKHSILRHLTCFHFLAFVTDAPVYMYVPKFWCGRMFSLLLDVCLGVELLSHLVTL